MSGSQGTKPVVFKTPTLGNPVRLGELYDQRSGHFLGVQLYSEDSLEIAETDIRHTDLSLSLSTTLEDKASLLDINGKISLEVMSGAVSVTGSAAYVKDTKSNTNVQAFALALKMRLNEKRILFAEQKLGRNVLTVASQDYIATKLATHFVSAITYGGSVIINLVSRKSTKEEDESISGQLQVKLNYMKGAISLEAEAKVDIKDSFKSMNDQFDLYVHGDVTLDRVPVNPQDVLDLIPEAASLIKDNGGVPLMATLQPIPEALIIGSMVYEIDALVVDQVFQAFSDIDDLYNRFSVLIDGVKAVEEFAPELARVARLVANRYVKDHGTLLHALRNFLSDYQHGRISQDEEHYVGLLTRARELYNREIELDYDGYKPSKYYPSTLRGLEVELLKFKGFISDLQISRDATMVLADSCQRLVSLSSLDAVCRALRLQSDFPLFLMSPITPKQPPLEDTHETLLSTDQALILFFSLLRENTRYFNNSVTPAHILYAETLENLKRRLPNLYAKFESDSRDPSLYFGKVDNKGDLTWAVPVPATELNSRLFTESSTTSRGVQYYDMTPINGKESFSIQVWAKANTLGTYRKICVLQTRAGSPFLEFQANDLRVVVYRNFGEPATIEFNPIKVNEDFVATFVQDIENLQWILYIGSEASYPIEFNSTELLNGSANVRLAYPESETTWWDGVVNEVRAYSTALTKDQIEKEINN